MIGKADNWDLSDCAHRIINETNGDLKLHQKLYVNLNLKNATRVNYIPVSYSSEDTVISPNPCMLIKQF